MPRTWEMVVLLVYGSVSLIMHQSSRHRYTPSTLANDTGLSDLHGNQIAKRAQSDEQVEHFHTLGFAKYVGEE